MEARPAEPLLVSAVLGDAELNELVEGVCGIGVKRREEWLGTGVKSLDEALGGGVASGRVVCVTGEGTGGSETCRVLLVQSLLKYPDAVAAVVDTTGNFDVMRLYTLILAQLQKSPAVLSSVRASTKAATGATIEDVAAKLLDRVKIMRVFDLVGVREAVGEIRDDLEGRKRPGRQRPETKEAAAVQEKPPTPEPEPVPKRTVVADSEDEDEDEEMLFDTSTPIAVPEAAVQQGTSETLQAVQLEPESEDSPGKVKFILIDNLAQVVNPLLKKDYVKVNALASTFLHTLNHLTRAHDLHTILANPATHPRTPSPARPTANQPPPEHQKQQPPPPPSIFASNTIVPSLASILPRYVDASLLVSQMPRKKMDAKVFYRDDSSGHRGVKKLRGVEMVNVLEVVSDRWESRIGAWGTFKESEKGLEDLS